MTWETKPASLLREFLTLLQPFAPHLAEELFARLDPQPALALPYLPWPTHNPALLVEDTVEIPIQVNGKLRDRLTVAITASTAELEAAALACEKVKPFVEGKTIKKVIVLPKKLVNIVVA